MVESIMIFKKNNKNYLFAIILTNLFFLNNCKTFAQSSASVQMINGAPALIIDKTEYPPYAYMSYLGEEKYYREVAQAGIHLYNFPAYFGGRGINSSSGIGPFRSPIWIGENQYDFSSLVKDFEEIIRADSQAKIIIRFYLDPPLWWEESHPEASCQLSDGTTFRQSFTSDIWRNETGKVLKDCIDWLLASPYANQLAGIHVASGFTEEWFYHPDQYHDINPERTDKFRTWLREKYNATNSLRKSWNNQNIAFNTAQLANISEPEKRNEWRNPIYEQNYIDTYQFHAEVMVDNIAYFCRIVKEASGRNLLTGAFYGYHYFVTDPRRGHGALAKLLDCPDLDYLSSPNAYNRVVGEDWPPMAAVKSVQLHGKLWLAENDTRTSITTLLKDRSVGISPKGQYESGVWLGPKDIETSVSLLLKNTGRMLTHGYGGWWFDMWGGWFSDQELLTVLADTQQLYSETTIENDDKMQPQVLIIVDEELSFWDASYGRLTNKILSNSYSLAKSGAPHDLLLRTDLDAISTSQYSAIWLMGILELNEDERLKMKKWRNQGKTVIWTDGTGTHIFKKNTEELFFEKKFKWSHSELRKIWDGAGVHVYIDSGDVFYIGRNWLSIHTVEGGSRTIKFPFYAQVVDPLKKQEIIADSIKYFNIDLVPKSTILLKIKPY